MSESKPHIAIIGAGMTGLCLAKLLQQNYTITLLDKSRGVGGRLATRRFEEQSFDTGAQFLRARSEEFREFLSPYIQQESIQLWKTDEHHNPMYWGGSKMTDLPKALAQQQNILFEHKVISLSKQDQWKVESEKQTSINTSDVVITAPLPQSLALLQASNLALSDDILSKMKTIEYRKTLGLLVLENKTKERKLWQEFPEHTNLERCVNQTLKGVSTMAGALMFHFSDEFSNRWIDGEETDIQQAMLEVLKPLGYDIVTSQVKKWRYADPFTTFGELFYAPPEHPGLFLAGDAFGGGSVEGTWRSAQALAQHLLDRRVD